MAAPTSAPSIQEPSQTSDALATSRDFTGRPTRSLMGKIALCGMAAYAIYQRSALLSGIESIANAAIAKSPALATAAAKCSPAWVAFKAFVIANPAALVIGLVVVGGAVCLYVHHRSKAAADANEFLQWLDDQRELLDQAVTDANGNYAYSFDRGGRAIQLEKSLQSYITEMEKHCKAANKKLLKKSIPKSLSAAKKSCNKAVAAYNAWVIQQQAVQERTGSTSSNQPQMLPIPYTTY